MDSVANDLFFSYVRLYGHAFSGLIASTIQSALELAEKTGDDFVCVANEMLNDLF